MCGSKKRHLHLITLVEERTFSLPVKIQRDCDNSDIAKSEYDKQISLSPTNVKGEGIKLTKLL